MSTIQIRDINTNSLIKSQQISDDAGVYQKEALAKRLADSVEDHNDFMYAVEVVDGVAGYKWEI